MNFKKLFVDVFNFLKGDFFLDSKNKLNKGGKNGVRNINGRIRENIKTNNNIANSKKIESEYRKHIAKKIDKNNKLKSDLKLSKVYFVIGFILSALVIVCVVRLLLNVFFTNYNRADKQDFATEYFLTENEYIKNEKSGGIIEHGTGKEDLTLQSGENLVSALLKRNFDLNEVNKLVDLLKENINLKSIRTDQVFRLLYSFEIVPEPVDIKRTKQLFPQLHKKKEYRHIENFHFKTTGGAKYNIDRNGDEFLLHSEKPKLITKRHIISGTITNSLFADVLVSDIKTSTLYNALNEYAFLIDFQRDLHKGDKFIFILDTTRDNDGDVVEEKVLYVNLILSGRDYEMFSFNDKFYNRKGHSIKRSLLKTPVDGARISSGFKSQRKHPILGYTRAHLGIDMAAPIGTPIYSAGDGIVVDKVKMHNGYGNFVKIRHNGEYSTLYAHMSKFANIKVGQFVRQRQVIGYVGMTGLATGPHLHYEVHRHGKHINPSSIKVASTKKIESKYMDDFNYTISNIDRILKENQ